MKKILLLLSCFLVLSCTAAYRPYKHQQGYVVLPLGEKQFRIEYYSNNPNASKTNWHTAAKKLCEGECPKKQSLRPLMPPNADQSIAQLIDEGYIRAVSL